MALILGHDCNPAAFVGRGMKWLWSRNKQVAATFVLVVSVVKIAKVLRKRRLRQQWDAAGQDVVVLHMFPRSKVVPNLSPFVIKLENYLKMTSIKYVVDHEEPLGPKGKCPWITVNGEDIADSQLIIERLNGRFQKDLNSSLTPDRKAVAKAFQIMVDEHLLWCLVYFRFVVNRAQILTKVMGLPTHMRMTLPLLLMQLEKAAWWQGIGRHNKAEVETISRNNLRALSDYLGHSNFLMGDEPTEVDCAVFGILAQFEWCDIDTPLHAMLQGEFVNLKDYCHRMKQRFWPDWERHCAK